MRNANWTNVRITVVVALGILFMAPMVLHGG